MSNMLLSMSGISCDALFWLEQQWDWFMWFTRENDPMLQPDPAYCELTMTLQIKTPDSFYSTRLCPHTFCYAYDPLCNHLVFNEAGLIGARRHLSHGYDVNVHPSFVICFDGSRVSTKIQITSGQRRTIAPTGNNQYKWRHYANHPHLCSLSCSLSSFFCSEISCWLYCACAYWELWDKMRERRAATKTFSWSFLIIDNVFSSNW